MKFHPEILSVFGNGTVWTYCCLTVGLVIVYLVMVHRRNKTQRRRIRPAVPAQAIKNRGQANNTIPHPSLVTLKNSTSSGPAWPKPVFRRKRRKRVFNYSKFYARVMRELSHHTYHPTNLTNRKSHANGHSHEHVISNGTKANQTIKSEVEDLIANQEILIRTQKSLLEEQARLIEEKSRVIEEQTAFLKMKRAA
jgi:hypothetical protein